MEANDILGVTANAGEEEIRNAYLNKVKEFPPDRSPDQFERIRDAYDTLRDPRRRARAMFVSAGSGAPLVSLIEGRRMRRIFAGPQPWREVLKNK
jgi:DnaJ-class molecular chaperone